MAAIPATAFTPIAYPRALWDDQLGYWVPDAEVAEVGYAAFTARPRRGQAVVHMGVGGIGSRRLGQTRGRATW